MTMVLAKYEVDESLIAQEIDSIKIVEETKNDPFPQMIVTLKKASSSLEAFNSALSSMSTASSYTSSTYTYTAPPPLTVADAITATSPFTYVPQYPSRMNPEVKALWVEALRSGVYEQGLGALAAMVKVPQGLELRERVRFCALGVLMELAREAGIVTASMEENMMVYADPTDPRNTTMSTLLPCVREWAGISTIDVFLNYNGGVCSVFQLNDAFRVSFSTLADLIEAQL